MTRVPMFTVALRKTRHSRDRGNDGLDDDLLNLSFDICKIVALSFQILPQRFNGPETILG